MFGLSGLTSDETDNGSNAPLCSCFGAPGTVPETPRPKSHSNILVQQQNRVIWYKKP